MSHKVTTNYKHFRSVCAKSDYDFKLEPMQNAS